MCLREIRIFQCPSRAGPVNVHTDKVNVLCSALQPCPAHLWERCEIYYNSACPACSGRLSSVPAAEIHAFRINWTPRDNQVALDNEWVKNYLKDWASFMNLVLQSLIVLNTEDFPGFKKEALYRLRESLLQEQACKEQAHRVDDCFCDANRSETKQFLYNPASGVRSRAALEVTDRIMQAIAAMDEELRRNGDPRRSEIVSPLISSLARESDEFECRRDNFRFFRQGRGRHRPISAEQHAARLAAMQELWKHALERSHAAERPPPGDMARWIQWHVVNARLTALTLMGNLMMEDVGISDERLRLAFERMLTVLPARAHRGPSDVPELEALATKVTQRFRAGRLMYQMQWLRLVTQNWLGERKEAWDSREATYQWYEAIFNYCTVPLTGQQLEDCIANGTRGTGAACPVCYGDYFDGAPDQSQAQANPGRPRTDSDTSSGPTAHVHTAHVQSPAAPEGRQGHPALWEFYEPDDRYDGGEIPQLDLSSVPDDGYNYPMTYTRLKDRGERLIPTMGCNNEVPVLRKFTQTPLDCYAHQSKGLILGKHGNRLPGRGLIPLSGFSSSFNARFQHVSLPPVATHVVLEHWTCP
ncbi:hypothetical protein SODALDRAFT_362346 [Sodiomyces alkalinus F11]|uniref:Uncharacterized protein n=1 Tax=Sodiomyces alkalinus (strain CBS 110278 / VKM F-3762 / F11) TaxID=1314773 RepID=A0A3N2PPW5_SODAK|nr:hypothetical protein SODALDRAFT_362346 [Sodiomyces alkalinus F11]ROT36535.1 hypothetical protein SODALDRAFT_362346 [Sodiomyces alkalinus F11]